MSRINCHSAFKHYEMFHGNRACCGSSYGSVFNTTYNINCGGHNGGFWGGFGMGLGAMVGNWFSGIAGNFGFGGFGGFGGGMGFGFPSFGSGYGNFGNFGGFTNNRTAQTNTNNTTGVNGKDGKDGKDGVNDADNVLIENFKKEIDKLADDASEELQKNIYNRIKAKLDKPEDTVYETANKLAYKELLDSLEEKYPNTDFGNGAKAAKQVAAAPATTTAPAPAAPAAQTTAAAAQAPATTQAPASTEDCGLTEAELKEYGLTPEQAKTLKELGATPEFIKLAHELGLDFDAMKALKEAGAGFIPQNNWLSLPSLDKLNAANLKKVAEISKKHNIPVRTAHNTDSKDKYITGFIDIDSIKETDGKVSYDIDCNNVKGAELGNCYTVTQINENQFKIKTKTLRKGTDNGEQIYTYDSTSRDLARSGAPKVHF